VHGDLAALEAHDGAIDGEVVLVFEPEDANELRARKRNRLVRGRVAKPALAYVHDAVRHAAGHECGGRLRRILQPLERAVVIERHQRIIRLRRDIRL